MKKILFIGNSLTRGECGVDYTSAITGRFPQHRFINEGQNGDTLLGITGRLIAILKKRKFDVVVIEAGINDILLPHVRKRSLIKRLYAYKAKKRGSLVTPVEIFGRVLDKRLTRILGLTNARILITTLSCVGEDLSSDLNLKRKTVNEQIRRVARKHRLTVANIGLEFDSLLKQRRESRYLIGSSLNVIIDMLRSAAPSWIDSISRQRALHLTSDGVHLNSRGAKVYSDVLCRHLGPDQQVA
ncbi:MAG: GDSL-type esterase/lipase family protein [archaeon]